MLLFLVVPLGCSGSDAAPLKGLGSAPTPSVHRAAAGGCVDLDADGHGDGCDAGPDCDDRNPRYTSECPCIAPKEGCLCEREGHHASCGPMVVQSGSVISCGDGVSACQAGLWQACVLSNADFAPSQVSQASETAQGLQAYSLRAASACGDNTCDPGCREFAEDAEDVEGDHDGVIVDGDGVSLPADEEVIIDTICEGGTFGECEHHVCEVGEALEPGCGVDDDVEWDLRGAVWSEPFTDNALGWDLEEEWEIGRATVSSGHTVGNPDPAFDTSEGTENGVAGVAIGGTVDVLVNRFRYLTSPEIDLTAFDGNLTLSFERWLNSDEWPFMENHVQVWDDVSNAWVTVWEQAEFDPAVADDDWRLSVFDVTHYRSQHFRVRFGTGVSMSSVERVSGWNVDDVQIIADLPPAAPVECVKLVCDAHSECCDDEWSSACIGLAMSLCRLGCQTDAEGECVACYQDGYDHDADGLPYVDGDCLDCDPSAGPGAFDFPGNGRDEDCDGVVDNALNACDSGLAVGTMDPQNYARAMDLCQFTSSNAYGVDRKWGVIDAQLVRADGTPCTDSLQTGALAQFGANNFPMQGERMAAFSSGTARSDWEPGYVPPNGDGYGSNAITAPPAGFPRNSVGCQTGAAAFDACGLQLTLRAPTNAESFSFDFDYFSSEYPEWVCTAFNDTFIALYDGSLNPHVDRNISFDTHGSPVSVNVGFFEIPGGETSQHDELTATGHDGECEDVKAPNPIHVCGGATGWLQTNAPVAPGEEITLTYLIWDTGDNMWDSTVLLDNFRWSAFPAAIETVRPNRETELSYNPGDFTRIYDADEACGPFEIPVWTLYSWAASTPDDSRIEFYVTNANSVEDLDTATEYPLLYSHPASLVGQPAVAQQLLSDTQAGSALVLDTLPSAGIHGRFLRVRAYLVPNSDSNARPVLHDWNLEVSCLDGN